MEKVLILSYYWPPSGGPGVQRWLKFAGYLPQFGYEPFVITVDPEQATYPVADDSLMEKVPAGISVFHTPTREPYSLYQKITGRKQVPYSGFTNESTRGFFSNVSRFIRGNLFIPDARKGWNSFALKKASELIRKHNIKTVITTSPPHSTQLAGLALKKEFPALNWIADLRDPWTDIFYYDKMLHLPPVKRYDLSLERNVLTTADKVVTVSTFIKALFSEKTANTNKDKFKVITNGFDEADFEGLTGNPPEEFFTISYVGTLSEAYEPWGFIAAIEKIREHFPKPLKLQFTGSISETWKEALLALPQNLWTVDGHVSHREALLRMQKSHLLLLIIPKIEQNKGIVTGKIFEYMASGRPILGIGPVDGDAAAILESTQSGKMFDYEDVQGMTDFLESIGQKPDYLYNKGAVRAFSRKNLTKKLTELF